MKSLFELMGGTYTLGVDGIYYRNLLPHEDDTPTYGKYGCLRLTYMRKHH